VRKIKSIITDLQYVLRSVGRNCAEAEQNHLIRRKIMSEQERENENV